MPAKLPDNQIKKVNIPDFLNPVFLELSGLKVHKLLLNLSDSFEKSERKSAEAKSTTIQGKTISSFREGGWNWLDISSYI
jgi:hypothetical protein